MNDEMKKYEKKVRGGTISVSVPSSTRNPRRVLMVTGVYPTVERPHAGTFIQSQVDSLIQAGLEVEVIYPRPGFSFFRYFSVILRVLLKTFTHRYDIVHGHYGQWCLIARLQWRAPVVASFMGDDLLGTPTSAGGYTRKSVIERCISRWVCHHVDAIIVKSEEMRRAAEGEPIFVIPNGVDFTLFHPVVRSEARIALGWDIDRYYVLFGSDPAIARKNYPLAQAVVTRLQEKGLPIELVVANGLPQTRLVQYINAGNALLLTSMIEGSPNIVKETMACNVPVVSTDVGDVAQIVAHTRACAICPPDVEALAQALEQALQQSGPTTGRNDIRHLERSLVAQQVIAVYEQVLRSRTARPVIRQKGTYISN